MDWFIRKKMNQVGALSSAFTSKQGLQERYTWLLKESEQEKREGGQVMDTLGLG